MAVVRSSDNGQFVPIKVQIGDVFGRWTVTSGPEKLGSAIAFRVVCECGNKGLVRSYPLRHGASISCGCYNKERTAEANSTHGMTGTPEFESWDSMKDRCYSPGRKDSASYYDKGIKVCDRWLGKDGFANFYSDMGKRPKGYTLDRIDNNGDYTPENCRWTSAKVQANNRNSNRIVRYKGEDYTLCQLAEKAGIRYDTLAWRIERWQSIELAVETKLRPQRGSVYVSN